jgi:Transcriptional regulator
MIKQGEQNGTTTTGGDKGDLRREQILEAARVTLTRVGFEKITTRRIAEEAGVNIATLHYYFGTKEALLTEAVRYAFRRAERRLRDAIESAPTATKALEKAFDTTWEMVRERFGILRYDLTVRGFRDRSAQQEAQAVYKGYQRLAEEIVTRHVASGGTLAPGITAPALAHYLVSGLDGVILRHALDEDDEAARRSFDLILDHALRLMGVERRGRE